MYEYLMAPILQAVVRANSLISSGFSAFQGSLAISLEPTNVIDLQNV